MVKKIILLLHYSSYPCWVFLYMILIKEVLLKITWNLKDEKSHER